MPTNTLTRPSAKTPRSKKKSLPKIRKPLSSATRAALQPLIVKLNEAKTQKAAAEKEHDAVRDQIVAIVRDRQLPIVGPKSEYLNSNTIDKALCVTRPEPKLTVDPTKLFEAVGPAVFFKVCRVLKVDFNLAMWEVLKEQEMVTDEQLTRSLPDEDPDAKDSITISLAAIQK
jgi:hypothetical protein